MEALTKITLMEGIKRVFEYNEEECPGICLVDGEYYRSVMINGKAVPIFSYRINPKIAGMKSNQGYNMKSNSLLGEPCALTSTSVGSDPLSSILFRELDVAEFLTDSVVDHITAYTCDKSANLIVRMKNAARVHMQLHSSPYGERQFHHELFTTQGTVSNRAVDSVIAQHALNIYTKDGNISFTDFDILLFGLTTEEQEITYGIYDSYHQDQDVLIQRAERLARIAQCALSDSRTFRSGEDW